jgi:hypothetical protein
MKSVECKAHGPGPVSVPSKDEVWAIEQR